MSKQEDVESTGISSQVDLFVRSFVAHFKGNILTIQRSDYIDDGWYIEIKGNKFTVYEIPEGGGQEQEIGTFNNIETAFGWALNLK